MTIQIPVSGGKINLRKSVCSRFYDEISNTAVSIFDDKVMFGGIIMLLLTVFMIMMLNSVGIFKILEETFLKKFQLNVQTMRHYLQSIRIDVNGNSSNLHEVLLYLIRKLKTGKIVSVFALSCVEYGITMQARKLFEKDILIVKKLPVCVCEGKQRKNKLRNGP